MVTICVGDLHGHYHPLLKLWKNLERHVSSAVFATATVIFLGDYNDRGPDTKLVLDWLVSLDERYPNQKHVYLAGNHDFSFAAFLGILPPAPEGFKLGDTWQELQEREVPEGWWTGEGVEDMHVQGRRWGGTMQGISQVGSTYDSQTTFMSYGVSHGDRAGLLAAVPESHKAFLRKLLFIYEQDEEGLQGEGDMAYSKLIAVHAGLEREKVLQPQLEMLRCRDVTRARLEALSGRKNVLDNHPELEAEKCLCVSGHHGVLNVRPRRLIIDESGGIDGKPIAAIVLPSHEIVRDIDEYTSMAAPSLITEGQQQRTLVGV